MKMSKMILHDPFGYSKHKLWPKQGLGVKLAIWLLTTKSQELLWFPCVQVACDIPLESSQQMLQLFFRPHLNRRSAHKVMGLKNHGNPNFKNFKTPNLGVPGLKRHLGAGFVTRQREYYKVVAPPKSGPWWVLWVRICPWLVHAPKMLQLCINQLIVWFVQIHANNWLACHSS
jgi:hypothetical protein